MVDSMARYHTAAAVPIHHTSFKLGVQHGNREILSSLDFEDFDSSNSTGDFDRHERIPAKRHWIYPVTLCGLLKVLSLPIR